MAASNTDKITDVRNAARPNSARATGTRSAGGTSLACDNLAGWPTASKVHFVTYQIDSSSAVIAGTQLDCTGIVSGNTIGSISVKDGTDVGNSVNDVVEMLPTAAWGQDLADALTNQHTRTGAHTGITTDTITVTSGTTLPAGDIGTADVAAAAITAAKLIFGTVYRRQGGTTGDNTWQTAGTSNTDTSAKDIMVQVGVGNIATAETTVTFPVAFNQIPIVFGTPQTATSQNTSFRARSVTTTGFIASLVQDSTTATQATSENFGWLAIGQ